MCENITRVKKWQTKVCYFLQKFYKTQIAKLERIFISIKYKIDFLLTIFCSLLILRRVSSNSQTYLNKIFELKKDFKYFDSLIFFKRNS